MSDSQNDEDCRGEKNHAGDSQYNHLAVRPGALPLWGSRIFRSGQFGSADAGRLLLCPAQFAHHVIDVLVPVRRVFFERAIYDTIDLRRTLRLVLLSGDGRFVEYRVHHRSVVLSPEGSMPGEHLIE